MAILKKYASEVVTLKNLSGDIYTLELKSKEGVYKFAPGQFLHLALEEYDPSGAWPDSRCFSIQSITNQKNLKITFAVKGTFTKRMILELKSGKSITLKLPYGTLFQERHNKENVVFIAGGTGITPYLSLFCHDDFSTYENPVLYLGVRNKALNLYANDLEKAIELNSTFKINVIYEDSQGCLNIENIVKTHGKSATYFISGPPKMISIFKEYLLNQGVPIENVRTDDWE